ncbi:MAG: TIGR03750 family conjugal transfer protein [Woeseia sp.]
MSNTSHVLADRLNAEPAIFRGCSSSELGTMVVTATLAWLPVSVLVAWLLGAPSMGLGLASVTIVLSVMLSASVLQRLKRGRPDAYYRHRVQLWLADRGVRRAPFIHRSGHWSIGRTTPLGGTHRATLPLRD